jgi:transposase
MRTEYFITMDTHCRSTDICIKTRRGKLVRRDHVATRVPQLRQVIESVPRPRYLAFEEGSLAGWLYRSVSDCADEVLVCDPRRNAHVAKDGDKDDAIDAAKLNDLYRAGFLKAVHQQDQAQTAAAKQMIGTYHDRVSHRVSEGLKLMWKCRRWGVMLSRTGLIRLKEEGLLKLLEGAKMPQSIIGVCTDQWRAFQLALDQERKLHEQVRALATRDKVMRRVAELPGYGPIRAATLIGYLDTPWRFKSKSALWKYVGIGLRREKSGTDLDIVRVEQACNRLLRNVTIGAAQSAIEQKENVFARRYGHWIGAGQSHRNARRNVARDQVTVIWGMWKTDKAFDQRMLADPLAS